MFKAPCLSLEQGARGYKLGGVIKGLLFGVGISKVVYEADIRLK